MLVVVVIEKVSPRIIESEKSMLQALVILLPHDPLAMISIAHCCKLFWLVTIIFGGLVALSGVLELVCYVTRGRKRSRVERRRGDGDEVQGRGALRRFAMWARIVELQKLTLQLSEFVNDNVEARFISSAWYIKRRTIHWYNLFVDWSPKDDLGRFSQFFRITPNMFQQVCNIVRDDLTSQAPPSFHSLPNRHLIVERQVALALRRLDIGDQLLGIGELFGLSKSTAVRVTSKFVSSFNERGCRFLKWPQGGHMEDVKTAFRQRWGFPNCAGAIDVTHFLIELPHGENPTAYYDWRHNYSITMQAVVDMRLLFNDVLIGCPGSTQDSRLLRTSSLFHNVVYHRTKLDGPRVPLRSGNEIREYLLGDKGYLAFNWLITPYLRNSSVAKDRWNKQHSGARNCVERAFGKLKGTWRILSRTMFRPKILGMAPTVLACVLLHNMAILSGEEIEARNWAEFPAHPPGYDVGQGRNREVFEGGNVARDALFHEVRAFYN